jgi:CheY-like chemotaxis protein
MAKEDSGERQERGRPRILIVDDNRDAADSLQMLLETMGYEAQVAYDGPAALRLAETTDFSVVLLDLAMPKMDGF